MSQTIYRATGDGYTGPWSCWTTDEETAEAYRDNPGFGGAYCMDASLNLDNVLDLRDERGGLDRERLAEVLGYEDPTATARQWLMDGWMYPWEDSQEIAAALLETDYDWIRYLDDYPEYAGTLVTLRGVK